MSLKTPVTKLSIQNQNPPDITYTVISTHKTSTIIHPGTAHNSAGQFLAISTIVKFTVNSKFTVNNQKTNKKLTISIQ
jgi:hypothetical protein